MKSESERFSLSIGGRTWGFEVATRSLICTKTREDGMPQRVSTYRFKGDGPFFTAVDDYGRLLVMKEFHHHLGAGEQLPIEVPNRLTLAEIEFFKFKGYRGSQLEDEVRRIYPAHIRIEATHLFVNAHGLSYGYGLFGFFYELNQPEGETERGMHLHEFNFTPGGGTLHTYAAEAQNKIQAQTTLDAVLGTQMELLVDGRLNEQLAIEHFGQPHRVYGLKQIRIGHRLYGAPDFMENVPE